MTVIKMVDHLNVQVPPDKEDEAKRFYGEILGLERLKKPDNLGARGAHYVICKEPWQELHLGIAREDNAMEVNLSVARHWGFQVDDLDGTRAALEKAGFKTEDAQSVISESRNINQKRFFTRDPGGNRVELLEPR